MNLNHLYLTIIFLAVTSLCFSQTTHEVVLDIKTPNCRTTSLKTATTALKYVQVSPNPVSNFLTVRSFYDDKLRIYGVDLKGKTLFVRYLPARGRTQINLKKFNTKTCIIKCVGKGYQEEFKIFVK